MAQALESDKCQSHPKGIHPGSPSPSSQSPTRPRLISDLYKLDPVELDPMLINGYALASVIGRWKLGRVDGGITMHSPNCYSPSIYVLVSAEYEGCT